MKFLIQLLAVVILSHSLANASNGKGLSRRGFLRGLVATSGAAVVASGGGAALILGEQQRFGIGEMLSAMREELQRSGAFNTPTSDLSPELFDRLQSFQRRLSDTLYNTDVSATERELAQRMLDNLGEKIPSLRNTAEPGRTPSVGRDQLRPDQQMDVSIPENSSLLAIRSHLNTRMLNRMAWQLSHPNNLALNIYEQAGQDLEILNYYGIALSAWLATEGQNSALQFEVELAQRWLEELRILVNTPAVAKAVMATDCELTIMPPAIM